MAGSGTSVLASDVNSPGAIGVYVMGSGSGAPSYNYGYGQTVFGSGSTVSSSTTITGGHYNSIRYDLLNASAHQNGSSAALTVAAEVSGSTIQTTNADNFAAYASTIQSNRLTAHSSRLSTTSWGSVSRTSSWYSSISSVYTLSFAQGPNVARYFWNAGGRIRFTASRTGGSATSQNTAWSNLLSAAGTLSYGASDVYTVSIFNTYTGVYNSTSSAPYASNRFTVGIAQNSSPGGSNVWYFLFTLQDPYTDPSPGNPPAPDDLVDGTVTISAEIVYPTGGASLTPAGNWVGFNSTGASGYYVLPTPAFSTLAGG